MLSLKNFKTKPKILNVNSRLYCFNNSNIYIKHIERVPHCYKNHENNKNQSSNFSFNLEEKSNFDFDSADVNAANPSAGASAGILGISSIRTISLKTLNVHQNIRGITTKVMCNHQNQVKETRANPKTDIDIDNVNDLKNLYNSDLQNILNLTRPTLKNKTETENTAARLKDDILKNFDISLIQETIKKLLASNHPVLNTMSNYYFNANNGKNLRPLLVLLTSGATANTDNLGTNSSNFTRALTTKWDSLPSTPPSKITSPNIFKEILQSQRRLAEITEIIHTASLMHDDVIDSSGERRGGASLNFNFGNKMAILAGDFLLARASLSLAYLENPSVILLLSTVISNLVEGEIMQLKNSHAGMEIKPNHLPSWYSAKSIEESRDFQTYLQKTYLKTGSLIAKSCQAATVLSNHGNKVQMEAFEYGRNLGMAFQLIDDVLDYTSTPLKLGKPVSIDLKLGLATAPLLYALPSQPQLSPLISRSFSQPGDVATARAAVTETQLEETKNLAGVFLKQARYSISSWQDSRFKNEMVNLTFSLLNRKA